MKFFRIFDTNRSLNPSQKTRPITKKKTCYLMDFAISEDRRVEIKESEKIDKYLDLARELKELYNMKLTMVPVIVGVPGTVPKGLEKRMEEQEIRGKVEIVQITALLRSAWILRRVLETWKDLLSPKLQGKTIKGKTTTETSKQDFSNWG